MSAVVVFTFDEDWKPSSHNFATMTQAKRFLQSLNSYQEAEIQIGTTREQIIAGPVFAILDHLIATHAVH